MKTVLYTVGLGGATGVATTKLEGLPAVIKVIEDILVENGEQQEEEQLARCGASEHRGCSSSWAVGVSVAQVLPAWTRGEPSPGVSCSSSSLTSRASAGQWARPGNDHASPLA